MISFDDITKLFAMDLKNKYCIEIEFRVAGFPDYAYCYMGKMPKRPLSEKDRDRFRNGEELYWFGLDPDGSKGYDYDNLSDFLDAPVFDGKSLKQVWDRVELLSIDGFDPETRIKTLLK